MVEVAEEAQIQVIKTLNEEFLEEVLVDRFSSEQKQLPSATTELRHWAELGGTPMTDRRMVVMVVMVGFVLNIEK